jgi:hypothetical protein
MKHGKKQKIQIAEETPYDNTTSGLTADEVQSAIDEIWNRDHDTLQNLLNDDHTQYALLSGRSGNVLSIDTINEFTSAAGVTIDGLLIKDGNVPQSVITEHSDAEDLILANQVFS